MFEDLEKRDVLKYFTDTSEVWNCNTTRRYLKLQWYEWLKAKDWKVFITLTFKNECYPDIARKKLKRLISELNSCVFGSHYRKFVGHSYFSYIVGLEYQKRGVIHFHMLVDRPIDFRYLHKFWNSIAGFAHVEVLKDLENALEYVTKYVLKCGQMEVPYFVKREFTPLAEPVWWSLLEKKFLQPKE